jgi:hypothetical protein
VVEIDDPAQHANARDKSGHENAAPARCEVCVVLSGEDAEDVIVLVDGLAVVSALLRVPPVGVGVACCALDGRWVDVAAVLLRLVRVKCVGVCLRVHTMFGSSISACVTRSCVVREKGRPAVVDRIARASGRAATMRLDSIWRGWWLAVGAAEVDD